MRSIAYLSSLPQPMTPTRTLAYARVIEATPLNENAWERVALVEAREIISPELVEPSPETEFRVAHADRFFPRSRVALSLAESLAHFLTLDLQ